MMTREIIEAKINNASPLDFGNLFNACIELYKKVWTDGLVLFLATFLAVIPLGLFIGLPMVFLAPIIENEHLESVNVAFALGLFIVIGVGFLLFVGYVFALKAGFYRVLRKRDVMPHNKDSMFCLLKPKYFSKSIVLSLAVIAIAIVSMLLCFFPYIFCIIPLYYVSVVFAMHPNLSVSAIIKIAFSLGKKTWFITFGLTIVASLLAQVVGLMLCGIGVLFTASFVFLPVYIVYKEVIGFNSNADEAATQNRLF